MPENQSSALIKNENIYNNLLIDVLKIAPSKIIGTLGNVLSVTLYTWLMHKADYGLYNVCIALLSLICILFSDWVGTSALRFYSESSKKDKLNEYYSSIIFILLSNLIIMSLITLISFKYISNIFKIPDIYLITVILLMLPVAFRALFCQLLRAKIKPLFYSIITIINQFLTIGIAYIFLKYTNLSTMSIFLSMFLSIFLIDLLLAIKLKILDRTSLKFINFTKIKSVLKYGIPLSIASLGTWFILQGNKLIVQYFFDSSINGIYGVAHNLTFSVLLTLFSILPIAAIPRIFYKHENNIDVRPFIKNLMSIYFYCAFPIVMLFCCFPEDIVLLFSNKEFINASKLLPFLSLACFCYSLTEYTTLQYQIAKKTHIDTIIKLTPAFLVLIFTPLFIKIWGFNGVGFAALLSNLFYFLLSTIIKIPSLEVIPCMKTIVNILISGIIAFVFVKLSLYIYDFEKMGFYFVIPIIFLLIYIASIFLINKNFCSDI